MNQHGSKKEGKKESCKKEGYKEKEEEIVLSFYNCSGSSGAMLEARTEGLCQGVKTNSS